MKKLGKLIITSVTSVVLIHILLPLLTEAHQNTCVFRLVRDGATRPEAIIGSKKSETITSCALYCLISPQCGLFAVSSQNCLLVSEEEEDGLKHESGTWSIYKKECILARQINDTWKPPVLIETKVTSGKRWLDDGEGMCGEHHRLPNGEVSECNPNGSRPCCSPYGWCGYDDNHCACDGCQDYRHSRSTTTTTTPAPGAGSTTTTTPAPGAELQDALVRKCHKIRANSIPRFERDRQGGNQLQWRCYPPNSLTSDRHFYIVGSDYTDASELKSMIDQSPIIKQKYHVGAAGQSCTQTCNRRGKSCDTRITTLDSTYLFAQFQLNCGFDRTSEANGGTSFWKSSEQPTLVGNKCMGFINVDAVTCGATKSGARRLCKCV